MIKSLFTMLILFCLSSTSFAIDHLTGETLLENCKVAIDLLDNNFGRVQTDSEYLQGTKGGICQGYLMSVNEMSPKQAYCMPDNVEMRRTIAMVVKYLKDHPKELKSPASGLVLKAYKSYFPCRFVHASGYMK